MQFNPAGELANDGNSIYPNQAQITYNYDLGGNLTSMSLVQYGATYVKTFTYAGGNIVAESLWVKQSANS